VTRPGEGVVSGTIVTSSASQAPQEHGWYLYGIVRRDPGEAAPAWSGTTEHRDAEAAASLGLDCDGIQLLERGGLAAVVARVPVAEFTTEALQARLGNPAGLESIVRMHNAVIGAVHQRQAILPAKLGAVYADLEDVAWAMEQRHDALSAQLERVDQCDEWAVHVYVDRPTMRAHLIAEQASDPVQQQLAAAGPGRAYLLRRKLADSLAAKTAQILDDIAEAAYRRLALLAVEAQAERPASPSGDADGEVEVLRAALLVRRERREELVAGARACAGERPGLRCTSSGPWPPYSFAASPESDGHA
jgi:hypothetical protein